MVLVVSPSHLGSVFCYFRKVGIPGDLLFVDSKLLNEGILLVL